jgi:hypothetical protein
LPFRFWAANQPVHFVLRLRDSAGLQARIDAGEMLSVAGCGDVFGHEPKQATVAAGKSNKMLVSILRFSRPHR